jgi:predicted transposase/invertase (TIGR01784 family)
VEAYNAIEGKDYPKDADVKINTLEGALYMDRMNDISFLLDGKLIVLIEHQSSLNENLPIRMLLYIGRIYEKILENANVYRHKLVKIPKPDFIVLYNGDEEYPDKTVLKLSDAFENVDAPDLLELTVNVYNINQRRNPDIFRKSKSLRDYAAFIGRIKENRARRLALDEAIQEAVTYCVRHGIMKTYLENNASEVMNLLFTEFNMDDAKKVWFEEGVETGIEKGVTETAIKMLRKGLSPQSVAEYTELSLEIVLKLAENAKQ